MRLAMRSFLRDSAGAPACPGGGAGHCPGIWETPTAGVLLSSQPLVDAATAILHAPPGAQSCGPAHPVVPGSVVRGRTGATGPRDPHQRGRRPRCRTPRT
jgi:hypothetical protein